MCDRLGGARRPSFPIGWHHPLGDPGRELAQSHSARGHCQSGEEGGRELPVLGTFPLLGEGILTLTKPCSCAKSAPYMGTGVAPGLQQRLDSRVAVVVVVAGTSGGVVGPVGVIGKRLAVCRRVRCIRGRTVDLEILPPKVRVSVRGLIIAPVQEQAPDTPESSPVSGVDLEGIAEQEQVWLDLGRREWDREWESNPKLQGGGPTPCAIGTGAVTGTVNGNRTQNSRAGALLHAQSAREQ